VPSLARSRIEVCLTLRSLVQDFHKRPEASKRGFDTFHNRATFRGLRYILLLEQILKNTPEDDPDRDYLS
jgi:hypothetical protein